MKKWPIHTIAKEMDIYADAWNLVFNVLLFPFYCICDIYKIHIIVSKCYICSSCYHVGNMKRSLEGQL